MRILVTGGAGFMGSNYIKYVLREHPNYSVVNLDKLTYAGNLKNLETVRNNKRYKFVKGDIANEKIVNNIIKNKIEVIVNFAAETHVDRSILGPRDFINTDVVGTHNLLEAARQHKIKRYIQISTDEVYGSIKSGKFREDSPFMPNSPYSASKASADLMVRAYVKTYNLPAIVTHSCNNFGPYQYPEKLIPLFATNLIQGKKIPVYGKGQNVREWIYVEDHSRAIYKILTKGQVGEIYNIGTGWEKSNMEITSLILRLLQKDEKMIKYVKDRPGHDWRYSVNSNKLRKIGWQPAFTFADAMKLTISWYKHNIKWWKPLKSGQYLNYYKKQYGKR
ncbi:dTDP-glucose 4,6-dehydratase [Patescibacteria group bacterium]|nr:dTDP-glucose 4,6-dehydratase [Patescibacteria group bacterium]